MSEENKTTFTLDDVTWGRVLFQKLLLILSDNDREYVYAYLGFMTYVNKCRMDRETNIETASAKEKAEASKDNTKAKKIPDEILERYPYAKWVEALDGITGLEWFKVKLCIDKRFGHLNREYEMKNVLSVSDMDINWYRP